MSKIGYKSVKLVTTYEEAMEEKAEKITKWTLVSKCILFLVVTGKTVSR